MTMSESHETRRRCRSAQGQRVPRRRGQCPINELKPIVTVEYSQPGTSLDTQLRREQARAILNLLSGTSQ